MTKGVYVILKTDENNFYLFSKNCFLFHFIYKKKFTKQWSNNTKSFKNSFLFLKVENYFQITSP